MSTFHGKWSEEDIREVIRYLDEKTGMNGASISIYLYEWLDCGRTLGSYHPSTYHNQRFFKFSLAYFNDTKFADLAAFDVIRHEYCHYLVDELKLKALFDDEDEHGAAWKTVCGLLNADQCGTYRVRHFRQETEENIRHGFIVADVPSVDILCQISRWGLQIPSMSERRYLEKELIKKYTKNRVFSVNDSIVHKKYGRGIVVDTLPRINKQLLYVKFEDGEHRIVQNRQVYKLVNGEVKKPIPKESYYKEVDLDSELYNETDDLNCARLAERAKAEQEKAFKRYKVSEVD